MRHFDMFAHGPITLEVIEGALELLYRFKTDTAALRIALYSLEVGLVSGASSFPPGGGTRPHRPLRLLEQSWVQHAAGAQQPHTGARHSHFFGLPLPADRW
jgi:hypothetical protein